MDITYKPYIRDNEFEVDYSIPFPRITSSYKPKYIVDEDQQREPEETSVKSDIDLTNSSELNIPSEVYIPSSRKQSRSFSSKEEFSTTMLPIYERLLKQKGLNPAFAKALVAQDGLESAWGKSPSGTFNFGGIKGKGTVKSTREVLNGKDVRIDQEFKDFSSLEDYANYKINLLNNKRYNAFSGSVNDFASRVAKGGYATDPEYLKALQRVIKSVKLGGILNKFQSGGKVKDRWTDRESIEKTQQWMSDWYSKRKPIINNNLWDDHYLPKWLQHDEEGFNWLNDRLTSVETFLYNSGPEEQEAYKKAVNGPIRELLNIDISDKSMEGKEGYFNPTHHYLVVRADSKLPVDQIAAHELAHSTDPYFIIDTIDEYRKRRPILEINAIPDEYLDNSAEIYARLMQYRKAHNIDPNYKFTKQDIENLRNNQTERIRHGFKFRNKNTGEVRTQILDRLGDIDQPKPYVDWDIEDVREFRKYKLEGDPDLFNRYNDDFLLFLLNDIAQNINTDNKIQKSKLGGIVPKYQNSGKIHIVKKGETLTDIAKNNNLSIDALLSWNSDITNPNNIQENQKIIIYPSTADLETKLVNSITNSLQSKSGPMYYQTSLEKDHKLNFIPKDPKFLDLKAQVDKMVHHPQYQNIINILSKAGLKDYVIHGIIGNMWQESQFDPNATSNNGTYKGLVQLSPVLWNNYQMYLKNNKLSNSVENQLQYLIPIWINTTNPNPHNLKGVNIFRNEWGGHNKQNEFWTKINKTKSASDAASLFRQYFERPIALDDYRRRILADWSYKYMNNE